MTYYNSAAGYSAGYSSGKSDGRREATNEFRRKEIKSLSRVFAQHAAFERGIEVAQKALTEACKDFEHRHTNETENIKVRGGFLWMFTKEASGVDSRMIRDKVKELMAAQLMPRNEPLPAEDLLDYAAYGVENLESIDYDLGEAAEFAVGLQEKDFLEAGYLSCLFSAASRAKRLEDSGYAKELIDDNDVPAAKNDSLYRKFMIKTVQTYAPSLEDAIRDLTEKRRVETALRDAITPAP